MTPEYKAKKALEALAFMLDRHGDPMDREKLVRLLYLAERSSLLSTGRPLVFDTPMIVAEGLSLRRTSHRSHDDIASPAWDEYLNLGPVIELQSEPPRSQLSEADRDHLKTALDQFGDCSLGEVNKHTRSLPEYRRVEAPPEPIALEVLLAQRFNSRIVETIMNELESVAWMENTLKGGSD